jgi:hypothetical protein
VLKAVEAMHIEPFVPCSSVKSFDVSVLRGLSRLDVHEGNVPVGRPLF